MRISRRNLLGMGAAGLLWPRFGAADDLGAAGRKFLFIHCYGGWDTTRVFQPNFGSNIVGMEADATAAEINGIPFVDHPDRPSVRRFWEEYGPRSCVINGLEVRSVTHERCARIAMTGSADGQADDWGATLAGASPQHFLLPYFVLNGTAFTARYSDRVVRVGADGQLASLLDGTILSNTGFTVPSSARSAQVDAWVRARMQARQSPIAQAADRALADLDALRAEAGTLRIASYGLGCRQLAEQMGTVWDVFGRGLARTALLEYRGWCAMGWDTHTNNDFNQSRNFEELFELLALGLADLDGRSNASGDPLADEVVVVVLSEMGRTPQDNGGGGRDHWTFTSALVAGAGVRGGQVVGGFDDSGYGRSLDYGTGEVTDTGDGLTAANFGATLLALGGVDPGETAPVTAVLA